MKNINIHPPAKNKWYKNEDWNWQQQLGFWLLMLALISFAVAFGSLFIYALIKIIEFFK